MKEHIEISKIDPLLQFGDWGGLPAFDEKNHKYEEQELNVF